MKENYYTGGYSVFSVITTFFYVVCVSAAELRSDGLCGVFVTAI